MDLTAQATQHPRYADHYTGELFFFVGRRGRDVILMDMVGHRTAVTAAAFERAYDAQDVVARRDGHGWELWLGQSFQGTLSRTSEGYALVLPGEVTRIPCRGAYGVLVELGLDPSSSRVLGLLG